MVNKRRQSILFIVNVDHILHFDIMFSCLLWEGFSL